MNSFNRLTQASGGLAPMELATALGESPQTLTNWAKRGVSKAGAIKAAELFNTTAGWFFCALLSRPQISDNSKPSNKPSPAMCGVFCDC